MSNIRLVKDGSTVVEADPKTVAIHCLGEIIISSVTSTPMTMQELRDAGVQLQPGDYEGRRFTMALAIGSQQVSLTVPVAVPVYNGLEDPRGGGGEVGRLEITGLTDRLGLPDLSVVVADITPEKDPFSLSRPAISHVLQHNFKALIVIPGSIGYLHQFYKANLVVFNALKEGSPFQITHLSATLNLPLGGDGAVGTLDDPLRLAQRDGETDAVTKPVRGPGVDGVAGSGEPLLLAGQSGMATFFVEALKEGAHQLNFDIRGQFEGGGLSEPVPLLGHAQGKLLVRNPNFSMVLVHPDVVRRGEEYLLEARLTNTSTTLANGVTVTLDRSRLGSVKLVEDLNAPVDTLNPGETAVFKFKLRALRNGEVRSSYLYMEQGTIGFQLTTGLGERNIRLNPDTLVLPQTLEGRNGLPLPLREAMLRVLGQAYSVASTKGALPPGVFPIAMSAVTGQMAQDLSEQGLFLKMGIDKARVWMRLWEMFIQNPDAGFDQLVRTTDAGRELREAFMNAWAWADPNHLMPERLGEMIGWNNAFGAMSAAVVEGARPGLRLELQDAMGNRIVSGDVIAKDLPYLPQSHAAWGGTESRHWISMPSPTPWARLTLVNRGLEAQSLRLATAVPVVGGSPSDNLFAFDLAVGQSVVITLGEAREGAAVLLASDGTLLGPVYSTQTDDLRVEPFKVLAVHRYDIELDPAATPYGTQVMMLFNRPIMALNLPSGDEGFNAAKALVQVDANAPWKKVMPLDPDTGKASPPPPALFKASARAASLYLERPVGPYVPRQLTLASTWTDAQGNALTGDLSWPVLCGDVPGGALVRGKVRKANGAGLPAKMTYWYQAGSQIGNVDLATGYAFLDEEILTHYALVSNFDTGADGSYQLDYVPEPVSFAIGPMLLKGATAEGTAWAQASVLGNGQLIEMDLVLEGKGSVDGYVLSAAGAPVAGAQVQVIQEQPSNPLTQGTGGGTFSQSTMTDADGHYRVDNLKTGVFSIRALKGLFGAATSNEISRDGETVHQNVVLESPVGTLRARLLDTSGQVVLTQTIRLGIASGLLRGGNSADSLVWPEQTTPGVDGWVTFSNVPAGDVGLMVPYLPLGTVSDWRGFLEPGMAQEITLKMLPPAEQAFAHFLVIDAAGNPVPGVYLSESPRATDPTFAITDENGAAPRRPVRSGQPFLVYAYHPGWPGTTQSESVTVQPGEDRLVRTILPPRGTLHGTVKYPDGTPVRGAYVAIPPVFDDMKRNRLAITDAAGAFLLPNVQVGSPFRLAAVGPELRTAMAPMNIQVADGQNLDLNLILPFVGKNQVSGVIYQPLEGAQKIPAMAQVWVDGLLPIIAPSNYGTGDWGLLRRETTGAASTGVEGKYTFNGLPQGTYTLHANSDLFPVEVKSGGDFADKANDAQIRDIYLSSSFAGELKGVIYQRDGQTPVAPEVRVRLIGGTIGELIIFTTDGGKYHFPKVIPEGCYKLRVEDPVSGDITVASVEMKKESSQVKNLRLWGKGTLSVKVQDSFGQILPEGVVTLMHSKNVNLGCPNAPVLDMDDLPPMTQKLKPEMAGELIFEDLLEGSISVGLKNPTGLQGTASVSIPEGGGNAEVVVRLQPVGDVLGTLYRADGSLVSAGRVDAYQGRRWLGVSPTRMDEVNGRFRFQVLPTGPITLEAWDPDSRQMGKGVVNVVAGQTTEVTITTHDKGPVVVTVIQEGQTVVGAAIRLAYQGGDALDFSTESTSDADGKATFYLPPGDYAATATDPLSLATGSVSFSRDVDQGEIQTSITLQAVRSLWATAVPPPGAPAGFSLEGWSLRDNAMGRLVKLDAKGQGMLRDLPVGNRALTLTDLRGRWRGDFTATLTPDGGAVQTPTAPIQATAYGNLEVTVLDGHGQLAPNVAVYASGGGTIDTDGSGLARFFGLRAGNLNIWVAGASGTALLQQEDETVRVKLQLPPTASMHGTVFDALGQPMPYMLVSAGTLQTATDGLGQFRVSGLGLGTYTVTALSSSGRRAAISVTLDQADQDAEVRLDFPPQGSLTGTVRDPLRATPPPIHVMVYLAEGGNPVGDTYTDVQGVFRFSFLPAGKNLRAVGILDDGRTEVFSQMFALAPQEGATQNLALTIPSLVNVKGWTLDPVGNKIPMTVLLLDDQGRTLDKAVTTGDVFDPDHPTFFFRYLLSGHRYRLMGLQETTSLPIAYLDYTPTGDKELDELVLQAQTRRAVKVQARYPDGTPTPGPGHFVITSQSILGGRWEGSLGSDGSALIQDLPEGQATVSLTGLPNQPALSTTFTIPSQNAVYDVAVPAMGLGTLITKVQTVSGRLLTGGVLTAQGPNTPRWTGVAQGDGTYRLEGVWIGTPLSLQATGFGLVGNAPVATLAQHGQQLSVTYPAPDQGILGGVVRDSRGIPVAGAIVSTAGRTTTTDAAGAYRLNNLTLGSYGLIVTVSNRVDRGLGNGTLVSDGQTLTLDVALKGTGTVVIKATKADGTTPIVGTSISLLNTSPWTDGRALTAPTDVNGIATFLTVLEGDVKASGTLLGSSLSASGYLQSDGSLALSLTALPAAVSVTPAAVNVLRGHTQVFTPNVTNAENRAVSWNIQEGPVGGSITTSGVYSAPAIAGTFHVVATSVEDPAKQATATVTVPSVSIGVSPTSASVLMGYTRQFTATVSNADILTATWGILEGAAGGSVSTTGLYTAPNTAGTYHVVAASVDDPTKQAIATVTVTVPPPVVVGISPTAATLLPGGMITLTSTVTGSTNTFVDWSIQEGATGGTVVGGIYTAPVAPGTYHVVATSQANPAKAATATMTVQAVAPVSISVSPATLTLAPGAIGSLKAAVTGTTQQAVIWTIQEGDAGGAINSAGFYTAPAAIGTYHVVAASLADPKKTAVALVVVSSTPPALDLSGVYATNQGTLKLFPAGSSWYGQWINGGAAMEIHGTFASQVLSGTWIAPAQADQGQFAITFSPDAATFSGSYGRGTAQLGTAWTGTRQEGLVAIYLTPSSAALKTSQQLLLTALVTGADPRVQWSADAGTVDATGLYTAPPKGGVHHITATSMADPAQQAVCTLDVSSDGQLDVAGTYQTNHGTLKLYKSGTQILGDWVNTSNVAIQVKASLVGSVLSGSWTAPSTADQGQFVITFAPDAGSFTGTWGRNTDQLGNIWTGTRQAGVSIKLLPAAVGLQTGSSFGFQALVAGTPDTTVAWSVQEAAGGSIDGNGFYQAPTVPGVYHVMATSVADPAKSAIGVVSVTPDGQLDITGTYQTNHGTLKLYKSGAQILGDWINASNVQIQVKGSLVGAVLSGGWTAPSTADLGQFVLSFSADGSSFSGTWGRNMDQLGNTWTGTRQPGVSVLITPGTATLRTGAAQAYSAWVAGTTTTAVTWAIRETGGGSIDVNGQYTAPATAGTYHIVATSQADSTKSATATVVVTTDAVLEVSGTYGSYSSAYGT
ncbi:carboxypeptidase-like regulatory domain-containing protein, partial [Geothrix fermentans]|uniref:carboxypeptidase-like regulatory domain-containing protein n=1 Tax=Geothrix fermentans TaxID=44676 RepID=UPI001B7FB43C